MFFFFFFFVFFFFFFFSSRRRHTRCGRDWSSDVCSSDLARKRIIDEFIPIFQKYYDWLSSDKEVVSLDYRSQLFDQSFEELLKQAERQDQRKQYTTVGTHRDDFILTLKGIPIKNFGFKVQKKSI